MKKLFKVGLSVVALWPPVVSAGVELTLGPCVNVKAVNDSEQVASAGQTLSLENGTQQLVVECTTEIGREAMPETSSAFVLRFTDENETLTLSATDIRTSRDMDAFNRQGNWQLNDSLGRPVPVSSDVLEKEGFQLIRDYQSELEAYNRSGAVASVAANTAVADPERAVNQVGMQLDAEPDQEMVIRMLRYWYLKADERTRNEWNSWVDSSN